MNGVFKRGSSQLRHYLDNDQSRSPLNPENNVTKTFLISTGAAAISSAFLVLAFTAPVAQASLSSAFGHCASNSKGKTVHCCETVIQDASLLTKQLLSGRNCWQATGCSTRGEKSRRCYVRIIRVNDGGDDVPEPPQARGNTIR
jgi:hypothetical protein